MLLWQGSIQFYLEGIMFVTKIIDRLVLSTSDMASGSCKYSGTRPDLTQILIKCP